MGLKLANRGSRMQLNIKWTMNHVMSSITLRGKYIYPSHKIFLAFRPGSVNWSAASDELKKHHTKWIHICFVIHFSVHEILGCQIPANSHCSYSWYCIYGFVGLGYHCKYTVQKVDFSPPEFKVWEEEITELVSLPKSANHVIAWDVWCICGTPLCKSKIWQLQNLPPSNPQNRRYKTFQAQSIKDAQSLEFSSILDHTNSSNMVCFWQILMAPLQHCGHFINGQAMEGSDTLPEAQNPQWEGCLMPSHLCEWQGGDSHPGYSPTLLQHLLPLGVEHSMAMVPPHPFLSTNQTCPSHKDCQENHSKWLTHTAYCETRNMFFSPLALKICGQSRIRSCAHMS